MGKGGGSGRGGGPTTQGVEDPQPLHLSRVLAVTHAPLHHLRPRWYSIAPAPHGVATATWPWPRGGAKGRGGGGAGADVRGPPSEHARCPAAWLK